MEVIGGARTASLDSAADALGRVEARLDPAYDVAKVGRLMLGDAPISLASTAVGGTLRVLFPNPGERGSKAMGHGGLVADGLFRGLFYTGGLLHAAAAKQMPWLVVPRTPPAGFAGVASGLAKFASGARLAMLGLGGVLGALRAAKAVIAAGTPQALLTTREGRGGVLQAIGSVLLMARHPITYLAGAGVFLAAIANEFL